MNVDVHIHTTREGHYRARLTWGNARPLYTAPCPSLEALMRSVAWLLIELVQREGPR